MALRCLLRFLLAIAVLSFARALLWLVPSTCRLWGLGAIATSAEILLTLSLVQNGLFSHCITECGGRAGSSDLSLGVTGEATACAYIARCSARPLKAFAFAASSVAATVASLCPPGV